LTVAWPALRLAAISCLCLTAAACSTSSQSVPATQAAAEINEETKFSVAEYGVPASARVTTSANVPKGGGRQMVGQPYKVRGKWYTPKEDPGYNRSGLASWYGPNFHGRYTANGEIYDQYHLSAAHPTFPLPSYALVTNEENGHSVVVRVNDRGPFSDRRIIDVSSKAAELLDFKQQGIAQVNVKYVGPARMDGHDMPFLMASYRPSGQRGPSVVPEGQIASGVMLAMNETASPQNVASDAILPGVGTQPGAPSLPAPQPLTRDMVGLEQAPEVETEREAAAASMDTSAPSAMSPATVQDVDLVLPDIGPVLPERPTVLGAGQHMTAAYAQQRVSAAYGAFDELMSDAPSLTSDQIVGAWKRRGL
jgi:rare lipoprotein A